MVTYPNSLAPSYFNIEGLPTYGLKIIENELGKEVRRFTENTGHHTRLSVRYTGMRGVEVATLVGFYQSVKGTFGSFSLPHEFYLNPDEYNIALALLDDTTNWRFENPPSIETIQSDIYSTEFSLISLKNEETLNEDTIFGILEGISLSFRPGRVTTYSKESAFLLSPSVNFQPVNNLATQDVVKIDSINLSIPVVNLDLEQSRQLRPVSLDTKPTLVSASRLTTADSASVSFTVPALQGQGLDFIDINPVELHLVKEKISIIDIESASPPIFKLRIQNPFSNVGGGVNKKSSGLGTYGNLSLLIAIEFGILKTTKDKKQIKPSFSLPVSLITPLKKSGAKLNFYTGATELT